MPVSSPITDPASYPGEPVPGSCIVTHDAIYTMQVTAEGWTVGLGREQLSIDRALARLSDAAPLSDRQPVLAIGSNASPGQLRRKWQDSPGLAVPVTVTRVTGIGVGFSAHVSRAGYVPYAPVRAADQVASYVALWLTDVEVEDLNRTEPNYHPTRIDGAVYPSFLESGQRLSEYLLYRGKWGVLADSGGAPVPIASQAVALGYLNGMASSNAELGADAELRSIASAHLKELAINDGF